MHIRIFFCEHLRPVIVSSVQTKKVLTFAHDELSGSLYRSPPGLKSHRSLRQSPGPQKVWKRSLKRSLELVRKVWKRSLSRPAPLETFSSDFLGSWGPERVLQTLVTWNSGPEGPRDSCGSSGVSQSIRTGRINLSLYSFTSCFFYPSTPCGTV